MLILGRAVTQRQRRMGDCDYQGHCCALITLVSDDRGFFCDVLRPDANLILASSCPSLAARLCLRRPISSSRMSDFWYCP
jgi:hypothetical protein